MRPWSEADVGESELVQTQQRLDEGCVASLMIGGTKRKSKRQPQYESESDDPDSEEDQWVCNMTGSFGRISISSDHRFRGMCVRDAY